MTAISMNDSIEITAQEIFNITKLSKQHLEKNGYREERILSPERTSKLIRNESLKVQEFLDGIDSSNKLPKLCKIDSEVYQIKEKPI